MKKYYKLEVKTRRKFDTRLALFKKNPFSSILRNHPLTGSYKGHWSINITGDLRALYVHRDNDTVIFVDIDTHSNLYE